MPYQELIPLVLIVVLAGLAAGAVCRKLGISLLIGYLVIGAAIGEGGLRLVTHEQEDLEQLAEAGALLLLFSVGIEFSFEELILLSRFFFLGGSIQMLLVAVPLTGVAWWHGMPGAGAILAGFAGSLSSTVLVFRALAEEGQAGTPHGKRALGILLFQDIALVPLLLLVPLLTGTDRTPAPLDFLKLAGTSALFVLGVLLLHYAQRRWLIPLFAGLRSVELVVLFTVGTLGMVCLAAYQLGLPAAVGALAAGMTLSGNRLSKQIDTILLPFRETFAAVFFVTLGVLLRPLLFFSEPLLLSVALIGMLAVKATAACIALKVIGLSWRSALGMGLGMAQLGEFSFLLIAQGVSAGIISSSDYNRLLFIALGTLIVTPWLLRLGLRLTEQTTSEDLVTTNDHHRSSENAPRIVVIGIGPIGRQVASRLETLGTEVWLVDLSPVNLHPFAQEGFRTVAGDARDPELLRRCGVDRCRFIVVSVPDDQVALDIVRELHLMAAQVPVLVRCRFQVNVKPLTIAGAAGVVSEEAEAAGRLLLLCEQLAQKGS